MKNLLLILPIAYLILNACSPDKFIIKRDTEIPIEGYIMKNLDSCIFRIDNSLEISDGSMVAFRANTITEPHFDLTLEYYYGSGAEFYFRTAVDKFEMHPSIMFKLTNKGASLFENNVKIKDIDSINFDTKKASRLHIRNSGNKYLITYNCDTLAYEVTNIENSEYLIIKPLPNSSFRVRNIFITQEDAIEPLVLDKKNKIFR